VLAETAGSNYSVTTDGLAAQRHVIAEELAFGTRVLLEAEAQGVVGVDRKSLR
jgi:hypothetical protein